MKQQLRNGWQHWKNLVDRRDDLLDYVLLPLGFLFFLLLLVIFAYNILNELIAVSH